MRSFFYFASFLLPDLINIVLPIALLITIIYTYNRFIADQELTVMRAAGMSNWQIAKPAILLATVVTIILYMINIYFIPHAFSQMRNLKHNLSNAISENMLQTGEFNNFNDLMVYVRARQNEKDLKGVLIYSNRDKEQQFLVTAEAGSIIHKGEGMKLILLNGARQDIDAKTKKPSMLYFDQYMIDLEPPKNSIAGRDKHLQEFSLLELLNPKESMTGPVHFARFKAQGHQRILNPLHAMAFTLIALAAMFYGEINRRRRTKRMIIIAGIACTLQLLTLAYINLSERYGISLPMAYGTLFLAILVPLAYIKEWFIFKVPTK